jgi:light-regulated signal transduction histidine kinase (bacteriophytochrome)
MPDMDGVTLAGELRADYAYLPIVLMTSVGDEMLAAEALRSGASDYIPKSRVTVESIRRIINRSILVSDQARLIDEQQSDLENFAYALAHDFKQPIRQISTFTQLISEEMEGGQSETLQQHLDFLTVAARRLGKLVDVMLEYNLLNQPPELTNIDVNRALASVRSSLAPYLAERGAELVAPRVAPVVRGNETLMIQVLQNLVMNGLQYNESEVPRVEVTARRRHEHWIIEVKDNGLGIEPQYLAEIFKPLVRLHNASEYPGSGLGLALVRKAVLAQNGSIWCESTPGLGSVFQVRLPAARMDGPRASKGKLARQSTAGSAEESSAAA